jgi:hypothetical protein
MSQTQPLPSMAPRIVSSIEAAVDDWSRPRPRVVTTEMRAAEQLLRAMHTVKSARFNAADRLERKYILSLFALSMVSLYFVGLSVWQAVYAPLITEAGNRLLTLVSIMSSIFTLVLALIDSMNDYKMKSYHLHACALQVNDLYQELMLVHPAEVAAVQDFRRRYNDAIRNCPCNHARVDYLMAKADQGASFARRFWTRMRYAADVYGLYGLCLVTPPLVLAVFH